MGDKMLTALDRIAAQVPHPFLAPVPDARQVRILSVQDGTPFWFDLYRHIHPGWWWLMPESRVNVGRWSEPHPGQIREYLAALPRFLVLALYPVSEQGRDWSTWICAAWNASDAAQRGWPQSGYRPRRLHLVGHFLRPLDLVWAGDLAGILLFDDIDETLGESATLSELRNLTAQAVGLGELPDHLQVRRDLAEAARIVARRLLVLREAELAAEREAEKVERELTLEARVSWAVQRMGAKLDAWRQMPGDEIEVEWVFAGTSHKVRVDRDLRLVSAGICLAGTEARHDLSSAIPLMLEARRRHRFDLERELWL